MGKGQKTEADALLGIKSHGGALLLYSSIYSRDLKNLISYQLLSRSSLPYSNRALARALRRGKGGLGFMEALPRVRIVGGRMYVCTV